MAKQHTFQFERHKLSLVERDVKKPEPDLQRQPVEDPISDIKGRKNERIQNVFFFQLRFVQIFLR